MNKSLLNIIPETCKVLFCSLAPDRESLMMQHYYASPRDKFWRVLHEVAFTEMQIKTGITQEAKDYNYNYLKSKGIGLTDLNDDIEALNNLVKECQPKVLAFNGKRVAEAYFGREVELGEQKEKIGKTKIFVLASSANSASATWNKRHWREVSNLIKK
jgi:double-stranded uracil-DNA glycosylase